MTGVPRFPGLDIHEGAVIDPRAAIGEGTFVRPFAVVRPKAVVGMNCNVHSDVYIDDGVVVGNGCKIEPGAKLFRGVVLEDLVFIGPGVLTTNDRHPRADVPNDEPEHTLFQYGASVGAGARILCGTTIGRRAMVGMASVVTNNVLPHSLVVGHPSRRIGWVDENGEVISRDPEALPASLVGALEQYELLDVVQRALEEERSAPA